MRVCGCVIIVSVLVCVVIAVVVVVLDSGGNGGIGGVVHRHNTVFLEHLKQHGYFATLSLYPGCKMNSYQYLFVF